MPGQQRSNDSQPSAALFRKAFLQALLAKFPSWGPSVAARAGSQRAIEIEPPNGAGRPLTIDIRADTVTLFPCCDFGLDYVFTARNEDLEQIPDVVFAKVVS